MAIAGTDYVYAPRTTWVGGRSGIVYGLAVGLPTMVVMLPREAIGGAGARITETRWALGGKPLGDGIELVLADPSTTPAELELLLLGLADGNGDALVIRLDALKAFRVKAGWFSRSVMWKLPEHTGWRALPISGKAAANAFIRFYAGRMKV